MNAHVGDYLKEIIVNQGLKIKDFAAAYKTTPTHMSDILAKKDINTSIIRKSESILGLDFSIVTSLENLKISEGAIPYVKTKNIHTGGRPVEFTIKKQTIEENKGNNNELYIKEIESLKALLSMKDEIIRSKEQIIKSKDDLIQTLQSK